EVPAEVEGDGRARPYNRVGHQVVSRDDAPAAVEEYAVNSGTARKWLPIRVRHGADDVASLLGEMDVPYRRQPPTPGSHPPDMHGSGDASDVERDVPNECPGDDEAR